MDRDRGGASTCRSLYLGMATTLESHQLFRLSGLATGLVVAMSTSLAAAQDAGTGPSLAERLGYDADAKLLIIHADDLGMTHSVNRGTLYAMRTGPVNSGSIMVPTPWFPEIAAAARENPDLDLGLHLTLTAEWQHYRWGPVLPASQVPTLLDSTGFLYATAADAAGNMDPREAEAELRAQVERAVAFGIRPTHFDSHMGTLFNTPELFEAYLKVGRDHGIPVMLPANQLQEQAPHLMALVQPEDIVIDRLHSISPGVSADEWEAFYVGLIENLEPGVTQIIIHVAYDDAEMQAAAGHVDWGAGWRQLDFDVFTDPAFERLLEAHEVHLITWREIGALVKK